MIWAPTIAESSLRHRAPTTHATRTIPGMLAAGTMDDHEDGLHDQIAKALQHRQTLWALLLATYRVELTRLLERASKTGFLKTDTATLVDLSSRIAKAAQAAELPPIRSDALAFRSLASTPPRGDADDRRVLLAGLRLIDRILDSERARKKAAQDGSPALLN